MKPNEYIDFLRSLDLGIERSAKSLVLDVDLAAKITQHIQDNIFKLKADADLLYDKGNKSTACAIAILAIEEFGKMDIIRNIFKARNDIKSLKKLWMEFRDHKAKNKVWTIPYLKKNNASIEDIKEIMSHKSNASNFLNNLKMSCLYIDVSEKGKITSPSMLINNVFDETIRTLDFMTMHTPLELYSRKYFEVLEKFLFIDKKPYSIEIYEEFYKAELITKHQYHNIIHGKHVL